MELAINQFERELKARVRNDVVVTEVCYVSGPDGCTCYAVSARMDLTDLNRAVEHTLADLKLSGQVRSRQTH